MPLLGPAWRYLAWAYGVLTVVLIVAAVTDVRRGLIYNWITYPAVAIGLIGHTLVGGVWGVNDAQTQTYQLGLIGSLVGLAVGFMPLLLAWIAGGVGGGDAKLMGAVGALAGWRFALGAMFFGFAVAGIMAVAVMILRRIVRRTLGRVGRFLVLLLTPTRPAAPVSEDSPKIPFGLALCIGSAVALIEVFVRGPDASKWFMGV